MIIQAIRNDSDFLLYQMPQGKRNTRLPFPDSDVDTRPFVKQEGQKLSTCEFYGFNLIRQRIGKKHPPELTEKRAFEVIASQRRKRITQIDLKTLKVLASLKDLVDFSETKKFSTKNQFAEYLKEEKSQNVDPNPLISTFVNQSTTDKIEEFVNEFYLRRLEEHKAEKLQANHDFLKACGLSSQDLYNKTPLLKEWKNKGVDWEKLDENEQIFLTQAFAFIASYKKFELQESSWNTESSIDDLILELKKYGPLLIQGEYGKEFYKGSPDKVDQVGCKTIYGWKSSQREEGESNETHVIVVIGARKMPNKKAYVYYVDPKDGSDPQNPEMQKIYVLSYDRLVKSCASIFSISTRTPDGNPMAISGLPYALRGNHVPAESVNTNKTKFADQTPRAITVGCL